MLARILYLIAALWLGAVSAQAQSVTVIGPVTPGNIPVFNSPTVIKDSGQPGSGLITSITSPDSSLTISGPIAGVVQIGINYAHAGTWTALQTCASGCKWNFTGTATIQFGGQDAVYQTGNYNFLQGPSASGFAQVKVGNNLDPGVYSFGFFRVLTTAGVQGLTFEPAGWDTPGANGVGSIGVTGSDGLILGGQGLTNDLELRNRSAIVCNITAALTTFNCTGITATTGMSGPNFWGNNRVAYTANHTAVTGECGITLDLGGSAYFTLTVTAASNYAANCLLTVVNEDSTRGKLISVSGLTSFILWPLQTATIFSRDGANWQVIRPLRWTLAAGVNVYVDGTNGNDNNDCLAVTTGACATIQKAVDLISQFFDVAGFQPTVVVANGTYTAAANANVITLKPVVGARFGCGPADSVCPLIIGNTGTPSSVILSASGSGVPVAGVGRNVEWVVRGFQVQGGGTVPLVSADGGVWIRLGEMTFTGVSGNAAVYAQYGATVEFMTNFTITAGSAFFAYAVHQATILSFSGITGTVTGTPFFNVAFVAAENNGYVNLAGVTWSGAATGKRFLADQGGGISAGGGGPNFYPGNAAGTVTNPGWYN